MYLKLQLYDSQKAMVQRCTVLKNTYVIGSNYIRWIKEQSPKEERRKKKKEKFRRIEVRGE